MPDFSQSDVPVYSTQPSPARTVSRADYAPAEPERQEHYSEWDPRSAPGTYFLLAVNIAVFLWMIANGVSAKVPTVPQLIHFGANNADLVLNHGQWFRLLTAIFVHIGLLHIATNMWCLWNLGLLGEPLLGPLGLIATYILTGVAGNLLSIAVDVAIAHSTYRPLALAGGVGAGASGAVFGIAGILIVLLSNRKLPIPWVELNRLRTSVIRFAGINLVIGGSTLFFAALPHIDNSAHIGGFLCGLALGPGLVPCMTAGRTRYLERQKVVFFVAALALSLFGYWIVNFK
jgi:rhomboid protease GluP